MTSFSAVILTPVVHSITLCIRPHILCIAACCKADFVPLLSRVPAVRGVYEVANVLASYILHQVFPMETVLFLLGELPHGHHMGPLLHSVSHCDAFRVYTVRGTVNAMY